MVKLIYFRREQHISREPEGSEMCDQSETFKMQTMGGFDNAFLRNQSTARETTERVLYYLN